MKIRLDLSVSKVAQVSLLEGDRVVDRATGTSALELIDTLLKKHSLELSAIEEIDSVAGPGSYTGLKIGAAIANTLNYSLGKNKRITPIYQAKND